MIRLGSSIIFALLRRRGGNTAIEFAMIAPILAGMLVGMTDLGVGIYENMEVRNAAQAGAQFGAQSLVTAANVPGITAAVTNDAANISLASGSPTVSQCTCSSVASVVTLCSSSYNCSDNPQATWVTVSVSAPFTTFMGYPGLPNPVTLTNTAQMQVLQ